MPSKLTPLLLGSTVLMACAVPSIDHSPGDSLSGRVICLDPGHGGTAETDHYRVGPTGEREECIDLRVALMLHDMLEARGARVLMTRTEDAQVGLRDRAVLAVESSAEVFLSIHHNATADSDVNFPIIYFHGNASENRAGVALGRAVARRLAEALFDGETPVSLVSDHVIFPTSGTAVLRHSYGIPGVISEASFFTNPAEEERLRNPGHNRHEAEALVAALEDFFSTPISPIAEKGSLVTVEPFEVFQEAERMRPEALRWRENFERGCELMEEGCLEEALELFNLSVRAFPDSWLARDCHQRRAEVLGRLGRAEEAARAHVRVHELYVPVEVE